MKSNSTGRDKPHTPWKRELQQSINTFPNLRRQFISGKIICRDEGWSFWMSSSASGRIDGYHYEENGRQVTLGGEGADIMDVIVPLALYWDDDYAAPIDAESVKKILRNITAAIQWSGFSVSFSSEYTDSE